MIEIKHKRTGEILHVLERTSFVGADLSSQDLSSANLMGANLNYARLDNCTLHDADLSFADLTNADLTSADLSGALLIGAVLNDTNLSCTNLDGADLSSASMMYTLFSFCDYLRRAKGLKTIVHLGPCALDPVSLRSDIEYLPDVFLRGVGYTDHEIGYLRALYVDKVIQYYSCFICYSHKDEEFAKRLHSRLVQANIRVWFAPEDMKSGQKLHEQIDNAIRIHDRLLLVLSEESMRSEWVMTEIRKARKAEMKDGKRKLFPISVTDWKNVKDWECFDADIGKDLGVEVREYFVPNFSNWKDYDSFEEAFGKLLESLQSEDAPN